MFGFQKDKLLVSFVPKRNKAVMLVSSMRDSGFRDEATKKTEIILGYNMTKGGVDTFYYYYYYLLAIRLKGYNQSIIQFAVLL